MTELPSTETNSTLTLQNATWLTTTSGEYDVGPSLTTNVKWLIFAISVIILIVIVCLFVFKRFYLRYRHESNEFHLFSNTPLFPLNELKKHSLPSGNMPDEEFSEPPACCAKGFPVEIQSEKVCNLRLLGTPSTKECDQLRDRIDDCVNSFVRATDREHSNSYEAPLSGINVVAATPLTSTPHQTSMNGALWFPTATNDLDAATTAQTATFTSFGRSMTCTCNNCDDSLVVPEGAVNKGNAYSVTVDTAPSFICTQHEPSDGYHLFAIKEFTEVKHRHFNKHVQIVLHYGLVKSDESLTSNDLRIRYSTVDNKHFAAAAYIPLGDVNQQQNLPDVFYTFDDTIITVYTTHFTMFKYESKKPIIGNCTSTKLITLVADVYGRKMNGNNSVEICVYVRDIYDEETAKAQLKANNDREHSNFRHSLGSSFPLTKLPATIRADTQFDCYLSFLKTLWKEFDLEEEIAIEASISTTEPANLPKPGCTMPRSMKAKDILRVPAHTLQPFGPFILKSTSEQLSSCIEACANIVVEHDESGVFVTSTIQINAAL